MSVTSPPAPGTSCGGREGGVEALGGRARTGHAQPDSDGQHDGTATPMRIRPRRIGARRAARSRFDALSQSRRSLDLGRGAAHKRDRALLLGKLVGKLRRSAATCAREPRGAPAPAIRPRAPPTRRALRGGFVFSSASHRHGNTKDTSETRTPVRRRLAQKADPRGVSRFHSEHDLVPICTTIEPSRASGTSSGRAEEVTTPHRTPTRTTLFPGSSRRPLLDHRFLGRRPDLDAMSKPAPAADGNPKSPCPVKGLGGQMKLRHPSAPRW